MAAGGVSRHVQTREIIHEAGVSTCTPLSEPCPKAFQNATRGVIVERQKQSKLNLRTDPPVRVRREGGAHTHAARTPRFHASLRRASVS